MAPKSGGKSNNFALTTDEQWNLELPTMLAGIGSELNSRKPQQPTAPKELCLIKLKKKLLEEGMHRLHNSIASINNDYLQDIELSTLLATVVENLQIVSHFKHETFTALQYSQDFGLITKESLKRVTKWAAKYFTHEKSYYPVSRTSTESANVNFTRPLPSVGIDPAIESAMKEFVGKYRPLRQRTVREETTKDRAGALPPAVYTKQQDSTKVYLLAGLGNHFNSGDQSVSFSSDQGDVQATSEGGNVIDITFVDDCIVEVAIAEVRTHADEYDTDSENDFSDQEDEYITPITVSRSGRLVRAYFRLDF
ncbi:hypothetical protein AWC38_SpisGene8180 [Stylophora pistillata]|uniref:Uncharacterized protein n=1 Tax=Stylophora pistillata TaxID=50429 RepID=A0A2B4SEZ8_STYPI|nr:hypothetical protein AWC38_SpisGene8180 [Stylophora pistillata]